MLDEGVRGRRGRPRPLRRRQAQSLERDRVRLQLRPLHGELGVGAWSSPVSRFDAGRGHIGFQPEAARAEGVPQHLVRAGRLRHPWSRSAKAGRGLLAPRRRPGAGRASACRCQGSRRDRACRSKRPAALAFGREGRRTHLPGACRFCRRRRRPRRSTAPCRSASRRCLTSATLC